MESIKQILTTREVAKYLGIDEEEVRRLQREDILKPLRGFRRPYKYSWHKIKEYLNGE